MAKQSTQLTRQLGPRSREEGGLSFHKQVECTVREKRGGLKEWQEEGICEALQEN